MNDLDKKLEQKETCKFLQKPCRLTVKSREIFYPRKLQLQLKAGQDPSVFFVEYRTADYTQCKILRGLAAPLIVIATFVDKKFLYF